MQGGRHTSKKNVYIQAERMGMGMPSASISFIKKVIVKKTLTGSLLKSS